MKENLLKNYKIKIEEYEEYKDGILIFYADSTYYYTKTNLDEEYINKLYNFINNLPNIKLHTFIKTIDNHFIKDNCILFRINIILENINIKDVILFNNIQFPKNNNYMSMYDFWTNKLDYLEYQVSEISTNKLITNSFDYYLGISEMLLDFLKKSNPSDLKLCLSHKKIEDLSPISFYNPLNITIDSNLRDISNYIKYTNNLEIINLNKLNQSELIYLYVRLSFPFKYFNTISNILFNESDTEELKEIIDNNKKYENYLSYLDETFGFNVFKWLKKE